MVTVIPSELSQKDKEFREKLSSNIRLVLKTGKLVMGFRNVVRVLQRETVKMVIMAHNIPKENKAIIMYLCAIGNIPLAIFPGTVKELGEVCGRPHVISVLAIIDEGTSEILKLGEISSV